MLYVKLNCVGHRFNPDVSNLNVSASSQEATFLSAAVTVEKATGPESFYLSTDELVVL